MIRDLLGALFMGIGIRIMRPATLRIALQRTLDARGGTFNV